MTHGTPFLSRRRLGALAAGALALCAAGALPAQAQTTMKLASATINDVQHEWQKVFAQELEKRVGDKVKVEIYPASQLGTIPRMVEGVLLGTIESFITPTAFLVGTEPTLQIFDAPGIFDSPEHLAKVIHDPEYRDHIETMALDKGLRIIGAIYNSPFLVLTKQPAPKLSDLEGLKIRTFASPLQIKPMSAIGASPLPLPLSEVVPALQAGAIDGMLAGMPILTAFKYYDIAKYVTDLQFSLIVSVDVVNEDWFQSQPADVQKAIVEAGRAAEEAVLPWGIANVEKANKAWTDHGGEILELSAEDRASMTKTFKEVSDKILTSDPKVAAEYKQLMDVVEARR
ncbi:TRAP-type C4-dicarboxylate transport system, substrate-binding protein [Tistlia consotensis]|uniref:TRAP-type C4-dicarboxylate transport system, substrate-binding protein n=1 Tax=Tistlia consotensis USBA 355 TaxID=560819 RepID=A0A1Y6CKU2_9PROT|nr:TRAP transporter substrate-binding protein [Tistlia consotensis]SMF57326.1 TRAP-type C4-dicarboxylate transport system, substrate-binding protein [Tistlia consotensis USBA 355]SNR45582.1 TRAP-type C4-dicarboxylate transport system, substrate-binding protein [Tistlia consotensis]